MLEMFLDLDTNQRTLLRAMGNATMPQNVSTIHVISNSTVMQDPSLKAYVKQIFILLYKNVLGVFSCAKNIFVF